MSTIPYQVVDTKSHEIYIPPDTKFECNRGMGEELFDSIERWSKYVAQIDAVTGREETYAELQSKAIRAAQNMRLKGIKPGDVISSLTYNNMDYVAPLLASLYIGAVNAPMDPTTTLIDITHCLKLTTPKLVFCEEELESTVEEAAKCAGITTEIVVFGKTDRNTPYSDFLIPREPEQSFSIYKVDDPKTKTAFIIFSSGTSGLQKGVCLNHHGLLFANARFTGIFTDKKRIMALTTPFWISNLNLTVATITSGDARVIQKMFDSTSMKYVADYKVNILMLTPVMGVSVLENREQIAHYDFSKLWAMAMGGSKLCPKQYLEFMKIWPKTTLYAGYGMTESNGVILNGFAPTAEALAEDIICVGTPIPECRYKIVDTDTEEAVGPNKKGELRIKYEGMMNGYYRNPEATAEAYDSEGFLLTGDIVTYTDDYRFFYVTRFKDIFKFKGFHVSPMLIEAELIQHPNIKEAVAFGYPVDDNTIDNLPTAAIIVKDADKHSDQDVIEFMKKRVPERYQLLGGVYVVDVMPTTSTGKIQRRKLIEMVKKLKSAV